MASEPKPTTAAIVDGLALWQEHKPQSGEDWLAVAQRFIAQQGDARQGSPIFAGLVLATERGNANEMRATMAEERVAALAGERDAARVATTDLVAERDALRVELAEAEAALGTYGRMAMDLAALADERDAALLEGGHLTANLMTAVTDRDTLLGAIAEARAEMPDRPPMRRLSDTASKIRERSDT